jgi:two-component system chemotaxis sensor kinase CheA
VLFQCLDALSAAIDSIDATGTEQLDPGSLITRLTGLIEEQPAEAAPQAAPEPAPAIEPPATVTAAAGEGRVLQVTAALAADVMMPSVRAYMVLAAAGDHGAVIHAVPGKEDVDSFDGRTVVAWVTSDHETEVLQAAIAAVPDVASAVVEELAAGAPAEAAPEATGTQRAEDAAAPSKRTSSTVRVDAERLDALMHLMGELVVDRTAVESLAQEAQLPALTEAVAGLTRSSQALQALVMQVRMIPVEAVFMRFPRLVRDLSTKLGKHVDLVLTGTETELDRTVVDALGDPLVHLVRNSLDHALEPPDERRAAGKSETGTIEISARHAGGNVVITVRDDGRGIDPERVARKAVARGLIAEEQAGVVDMQWAIDLLFTAGFSTAEQTSDISGRGVGMDAVRTQIRELGGAVMMTSEPGSGTSVQIRLPLTLAIMPALLTQSGDTPFAIPLERVERTLNLAQQTVRSVTGQRMLVLGDGVLPLIDLADALGYPARAGGDHVVLVRGAERRIALVVDQLVGQRELVTRPLPAAVGDDLALSGGAVLADGSIALIVDCDALAEQMARAPRAADTRSTPTLAHAA